MKMLTDINSVHISSTNDINSLKKTPDEIYRIHRTTTSATQIRVGGVAPEDQTLTKLPHDLNRMSEC